MPISIQPIGQSSILRHHKKHHGSTNPPVIVPGNLVLRAFVVESLAIRKLAQVAPEDNGVVQGKIILRR